MPPAAATSSPKKKPRVTPKRFLDAVKAGAGDKIRQFLADNPKLAQSRDRAGVSAVMHAVYSGHHELLELLVEPLIEAGVELDLFEAAAVGRTERLRELLDADPEAVHAISPDGFTALGLAAFFGHAAELELLLARGADPNLPSQNPMKVRPIHSAVAHRGPAAALEMARLLLAAGADVDVEQAGGWTPLHQAAAHGHEELARLLIAHGADPRAKSDDDKTALDMAIERGHRHLVPALSPPTPHA